jgi:hypothetical protein
MPEGFFDRWSRRKQQVREGGAVPPEPERPVQDAAAPAPTAPAAAQPLAEAPPAPEVPPPTLEDAQALTPESDFRPFTAKNVAPEVRNLAFRKLFADPHFNVMDGLDVYIDDYSNPAPLPEASLRKMASAAFLKLTEDEAQETLGKTSTRNVAQSGDPGEVSSPPAASSPEELASKPPASHETDDDADLRLQPDDATGAGDPRHRPG